MNYEPAAAVAVLSRTPSTLRAMLSGLPDAWLMNNEGPDTWSPYDVVGHLVHGDRADWTQRATLILEQGEHRTFKSFDRTAMFEESKGKTIDDLLEEFAELRDANLGLFTSWEIEDTKLALTGIHPKFGTVTLRQLLSTWVAHDLSHIAQISRVMAKQYREEIGPWREFLPIMDR